MKVIHLGKWGKWGPQDPQTMKDLEKVVQAVEKYGEVRVSFDYEGRTRHEGAARSMAAMLPNYKTEIGYNYHFVVRKP